MLITKQ